MFGEEQSSWRWVKWVIRLRGVGELDLVYLKSSQVGESRMWLGPVAGGFRG